MIASIRESAWLFVTLLALLVGLAATVHADPFIAPNDSVPNPAQPYTSTGNTVYPGGITTLFWWRVPGAPGPTPVGPGNWAIDSFFDIEYRIDFSGGPPGSMSPQMGMGHGHVTGTGTGTTDRMFDTEMLQLDLSGGPLMIRESPTLPSMGKTAITDLGGGQFHIDSFFDIFTELSVDGGQTWYPAEAPTHMTTSPEPASIALFAIGAVALLYRVARRRFRV